MIRFFDDRTLLWNPGDAYASADDLLDPGDKELRNPKIVAAFRRIGLSEQAGPGMRAFSACGGGSGACRQLSATTGLERHFN